jgi:hypothetical protein
MSWRIENKYVPVLRPLETEVVSLYSLKWDLAFVNASCDLVRFLRWKQN